LLINYKNILIIQTAFIGDAILASSLLEKLHTYFPKAHISLLVRNGNESIYHNHPFLKEVMVWNKQKHKIKHLLQLLFKIRKHKYDLIVNCHRYASSGFLTGFSKANHTCGYKQNPFSFLFNYTVKHHIGDGRHEIYRYNQLIEDITDERVFKPKLYPSVNDLAAIKSYQIQPYVCMAPASVWFTKQLPLTKWVELCNKTESNTRIYLLGASNDVALCEKIKFQSTHQNIHVVAGKLSLLQSCGLMANAKMNYVNDSGPLHLASSVNAPVTAFFTSTVPAFGFGPLSDASVIIEVNTLTCRPCGLHGQKSCPLTHFNCGNLIYLDSVT
jgi:heptosyltransferase II